MQGDRLTLIAHHGGLGSLPRGLHAMFMYNFLSCNSSSICLRRFNLVFSSFARAIQPR